MSKKKGLKRGLDHLFEDNNNLIENDNQEIHIILLEDIIPNPYQPRKNFDEDNLKDLAISIKENGVFQPILVRKNIIGYEIISGERRYRASKKAGLEEIPAIIYDYNDQQMMEVALIENIQREDLNIIDEANSYQSLIKELKYTQDELAKKIGKSRSHISNVIRILELEEKVLAGLKEKKISLGHAKILIGIKDKKEQIKIYNDIISNALSVRELENKLKKTKTPKEKKKATIKKNNYYKIENLLIEKLGTKVEITGEDKGKIKIEYSSRNDLERLLEKLNLI